MDKKQVKAIADTEVKKHETRMHKGKGFKKGGPTTDDRMRLGRNLSRAASQKTG
mgnify:CR=1 FL=1